MSNKITYYKHTQKSNFNIQEFNDEQLNSGDNIFYIRHFKYVPLENILDKWDDNMTQNEYLNYVMIKYCTRYHKIIEKIKNGEEIDPIVITFYDYEYYKKNKVYKVDLWKLQKSYLLASYHMGYTHIPAIIETESSPYEYQNPAKRKKIY